jgi:cardiolipin synthase
MPKLFLQFVFILSLFFSTASFAQDTLITEPDDGEAPLISAVVHANKTIDLVIYGFTDQQFASELIAAKEHGKSVRVLIQQHPYMTDNENQAIITMLQNAGVPMVFADQNFKLTHQKTLIIDNKNALVMTFNLTHSTFKNERNFGLFISDPSALKEIEAVFDADWHHQAISVHNPNLIWSPDNSREKLLALIHQAHHDIKVYAENITDYEMVGALANAARNGVHVKILTSNESNKASGKKFQYLEKAGALIRISKNLIIHAKVFLIDNQTIVLGSINMTKPSINDNRELAVISHNEKISQQIENTFDQDWNDAIKDKSVIARNKSSDYQQTRRLVIKLVKLEHRYLHHAKKRYHHGVGGGVVAG